MSACLIPIGVGQVDSDSRAARPPVSDRWRQPDEGCLRAGRSVTLLPFFERAFCSNGTPAKSLPHVIL